jgi:hypothetical protein
MGYYLRAFVGDSNTLQKLTNVYKSSKLVSLIDSLSMIPFTDLLFDEIPKFQNSENISRFELLTTDIETSILNLFEHDTVGYFEADYFGGEGGQMGIIWKEGKRLRIYDYSQGVINSILKYFGVKTANDLDEFESLNLGRHRDTNDWAE